MKHIFASACLYRWDLPLSAFWVCDPALKGECCFLQKHRVFVPGSSSQVLQVGRSVERRKLLPGESFPSGQEGFVKVKSGRQAGGVEDCHPSRASQKQQLEKTPTTATFAETSARSLCRDLCVWRCFSPIQI